MAFHHDVLVTTSHYAGALLWTRRLPPGHPDRTPLTAFTTDGTLLAGTESHP
ncbi:hypothetical protein [Actinocorallia herbida]|uniref:hypothetical protein n=1 Tax=Actinocorallia herbida TaxID=58109 RepID=UPI001476D851|nr:hypothetical protein [Actinocorallia herbida]